MGKKSGHIEKMAFPLEGQTLANNRLDANELRNCGFSSAFPVDNRPQKCVSANFVPNASTLYCGRPWRTPCHLKTSLFMAISVRQRVTHPSNPSFGAMALRPSEEHFVTRKTRDSRLAIHALYSRVRILNFLLTQRSSEQQIRTC